MAPKSEVAVQDSAELVAAENAELEASLAAQQQGEVDSSDIQIPLLKIGQPLTVEVANGDARPGEFINSLTSEGLGSEIEFVVAGYRKGRFDHGDRKTGKRARKAYGVKNVPWTDDPFNGRPFSEHPDAEETYSKRVNNGDIEWGSGPRISTTYDFTGFVVSDDPDEVPMPVCLSLMRMNTKVAKKWITIISAVLRNRAWDQVFRLTTEQQRNDQGNYYTLALKQARKTTSDERQQAVELAQILANQRVEFVGDDDEGSKAAVEPPEAGGGAAV